MDHEKAAIVIQLSKDCISLGEIGAKLSANKLVDEDTATLIQALDNQPVTSLDEVTALTQKVNALGLDPVVESAVISVIGTMHKASK